jgi:hypothetical protein
MSSSKKILKYTKNINIVNPPNHIDGVLVISSLSKNDLMFFMNLKFFIILTNLI